MTLLGYVVIGDGSRLQTRMVPTLEAAHRLAHNWDRQIARYYGGGYDARIAAVRRRPDGFCYTSAGGGADGEPGTGLAGMGVGGSTSADLAADWLRSRSKRWLTRHNIALS